MLGAFWRGEITLRQLRVYIEHLPPGSALHRARLGGHQWTNVEALLWLLTHLTQRLEQRLVWTKGKKPKWPKWRQFPWAKDQIRTGNRGEASTEQVLDYLESIGPGKKK